MSSIFLKSRVPVGILCLILGIVFLRDSILLTKFNFYVSVFIVASVFIIIASILFLLKKKTGWILLFVVLIFGSLSFIILTIARDTSTIQLLVFVFTSAFFLYSTIVLGSTSIRALYNINHVNVIQSIVILISIIVIIVIQDFMIF